MTEPCTFPTQGEVLRFFYTLAGVLGAKRDPDQTPEPERQALRRTIDRLAKEDNGSLMPRYGTLVQRLANRIGAYVEHPLMNFALGDVVNDLLECYRKVVQQEATYLGQRDTVRWLALERLAPTAAVSLARTAVEWDLPRHCTWRPADPLWFLPDFDGKTVIWPLAKTLKAVYAAAGLSQTEFHYPGRDAAELDAAKQNQLENAQNWTSGRSTPQSGDLLFHLEQALNGRLTAIDVFEQASHRLSVRAVLFAARACTVLWQSIEAAFGRAHVEAVRERFLLVWQSALQETMHIENALRKSANAHGLDEIPVPARRVVVENWAGDLRLRVAHAAHALAASTPSERPQLIDSLRLRIGELPMILATIPAQAPVSPPHFADVMRRGEALRRASALSLSDIESFARHMETVGLTETLGWMPPWLRFVEAYRRQDHAAAWPHIQTAYALARYRAGSSQRSIVLHYIEMAAKLDELQAFRKGIDWAEFIDLRSSWLPRSEDTDASMAAARLALKQMIFPV